MTVPSLVSTEEAIAFIAERLRKPRRDICSLDEALGRITAKDVRAPFDYPQYPISQIDGFCLVTDDEKSAGVSMPCRLQIVGEVHIGERSDLKIGKGECAVISTGCILPSGANAVVPREEVGIEGNKIALQGEIARGQNIAASGEVFRKGDIVVPEGTLINGAVIAVLAGLGLSRIEVKERPRVAIVVTGEELLHDAGELKTFESNAYLLRGLLHPVCEVVGEFAVGSDFDAFEGVLRCLGKCDLVIMTGGTGLGSTDFTRAWLRKISAEIVFNGIHSAPGCHVMFASACGFCLLCLPGKPVGCFILFNTLLRPVLARFFNSPSLDLYRIQARLKDEVTGRHETPTWMLGSLGENLEVKSLAYSSGLDFTAPMNANCILRIPAGKGIMRKGESIEVRLPVQGFGFLK